MLPAPESRCPCWSADVFGDCCGPVLNGERPAPTAEALMRSRFTAFVLGDRDHLLRSWHRSTRPRTLTLDDGIRWTRLEVLTTVASGDRGLVEFRAHFRRDRTPDVLHERSAFVRENGAWFYVDGVTG